VGLIANMAADVEDEFEFFKRLPKRRSLDLSSLRLDSSEDEQYDEAPVRRKPPKPTPWLATNFLAGVLDAYVNDEARQLPGGEAKDADSECLGNRNLFSDCDYIGPDTDSPGTKISDAITLDYKVGMLDRLSDARYVSTIAETVGIDEHEATVFLRWCQARHLPNLRTYVNGYRAHRHRWPSRKGKLTAIQPSPIPLFGHFTAENAHEPAPPPPDAPLDDRSPSISSSPSTSLATNRWHGNSSSSSSSSSPVCGSQCTDGKPTHFTRHFTAENAHEPAPPPPAAPLDDRPKWVCSACGVQANSATSFKRHLQGKSHRRLVAAPSPLMPPKPVDAPTTDPWEWGLSLLEATPDAADSQVLSPGPVLSRPVAFTSFAPMALL
jgi:hypothetical protein